MGNGEMTAREMGRKGGNTTSERYGHEFYKEIGKRGGDTVRDRYGIQYYEEIGRKGGQRKHELAEAGKRALGE